MRTDYNVTITDSNRKFTAMEKLYITDMNDAKSLDIETQEMGAVPLRVKDWARCSIHNEHADNTDYKKLVLITDDGEKYVTGSEAFTSEFIRIYEAVQDDAEENGISDFITKVKAFRKESNNYKGKQFLTCSIML